MNSKKTPQQKQQDYAKNIADELITLIKAGTAPFQIPWKPAMGSGLPYNHITGKEYSGSNTLYLMMQNRNDPRWLTYRQAQSVGAQVRKGERGVSLIKLVTHSERVNRDENGKPVLNDKGEPEIIRVQLAKPFIKNFTVFNAQQIDGLPPLKQEPLPELTWSSDNPAERILIASKAEIEHKPDNKAYYNLLQDKIVLPEQTQFADAGSYYAVALHELGHWTGHESRLNRQLMNRFGSDDYAREELRAEIASMMINRQLGMPHNPERHAAYVENWVSVLRKDPTEILDACRDAQKIQKYVLSFQQQQQIAPEPVQNKLTPEEELLNRAKEIYLSQNSLLSKTEHQHRQIRMYAVEKVLEKLPDNLKAEALTNFYKQEIKAAGINVEYPQDKGILEEYER
ncbi:ArdC family protein [Snodgrassella communis]|uniref:ArdC family protein n=1 Tax=Snodgrassella communis TaxID=2946699 RepID=UPI001EF66020|nr:zincin-like metallopeptidase domain-containing protein [Snodgrassella communis]